MTEARAIAEHGSRIIAALERAWAGHPRPAPRRPQRGHHHRAGASQKAHLRATGCAGSTGLVVRGR